MNAWLPPQDVFPPPDRYGMTLNGEPFYGSCAPLAVGMVTDFWSQQDPTRWGAVSPQSLIDSHANQFTEGGIGIHQFEQNLRDAGYDYQTYMNSDFDTLSRIVVRKPVIAHIRWEFNPEGAAHAVIVHKIDKDGVHIADPGTATEYVVPEETFRQSWESDFGGQSRVFHVIAPPVSYWRESKKRDREPWAAPREVESEPRWGPTEREQERPQGQPQERPRNRRWR